MIVERHTTHFMRSASSSLSSCGSLPLPFFSLTFPLFFFFAVFCFFCIPKELAPPLPCRVAGEVRRAAFLRAQVARL